MVSLSIIAHIVLLVQAPQPTCSLTIHLVDTKGRPVHDYVTVVESGGRQTEKKHYPGGIRFCDLGILPVRIEVRPLSISCTWTFSQLVDVRWGQARSHTIIVPSDPCEHRVAYPAKECTVLFRTKDEDGKWLAESRIVLSTPRRETLTTDAYGRVMLRVPTGSLVTSEVSAPGHRTLELKFTCDKPMAEREIELVWVP